jgi:putative ABC transport system permease protein
MRPTEGVRLAIEALAANRMRSLLTMFGVIVGVAAVVLLVAVGAGAQAEVTRQVEGLGSNVILIVPGRVQGFNAVPAVSHLQLEDARVLAQVTGDPRAVTATLTSGASLRVGTRELFVSITGADANYPRVLSLPVARGSYFSSADVDTRRRVVVLGALAARELFGEVDPLGRQVDIAGASFRVVGVLAQQGSTFGFTRDREVHIPVTTAQALFGLPRVDGFAVRAPTPQLVSSWEHQLVSALRDRYPREEFSAISQTQILGTAGTILNLFTLVLASIAAISLVVGGVGVSNIMLVSVRERTREVGLRKALGARQRDVLIQFLVEAVVLTTVGGLIGLGVGVGGARLINALSPLPAVVAWWSPALAFGMSVVVGVFFGVAPARRAARLDPVVALRAE